MRPAIGQGDVCAVVVTYHPDTNFDSRLARVLPQVSAAVIVDNGSTASEIAMLQRLSGPSISVALNGENLGIARALNIGIERAAALGFSWVLMLDQDTLVDENMVHTLSAVLSTFPETEPLAMIGAGFRDPAVASADSAHDSVPLKKEWQEVESVITSGSLMPLPAHREIGPFRNEFFIDYVDTEYCLRARAKGYHIIKTNKAIMSHAIGAPTVHRWLWITRSMSNHSPDRRYYIARNDTVLLREYGSYASGLWVLKSFGRRFRTCKHVALYESEKGRKIFAIAQGWWDGVLGHLGPRH